MQTTKSTLNETAAHNARLASFGLKAGTTDTITVIQNGECILERNVNEYPAHVKEYMLVMRAVMTLQNTTARNKEQKLTHAEAKAVILQKDTDLMNGELRKKGQERESAKAKLAETEAKLAEAMKMIAEMKAAFEIMKSQQ